jgi:hypothetical protein
VYTLVAPAVQRLQSLSSWTLVDPNGPDVGVFRWVGAPDALPVAEHTELVSGSPIGEFSGSEELRQTQVFRAAQPQYAQAVESLLSQVQAQLELSDLLSPFNRQLMPSMSLMNSAGRRWSGSHGQRQQRLDHMSRGGRWGVAGSGGPWASTP